MTRALRSAIFQIITCLIVSAANAQTAATVEGVIKDSTGAPIPGARVVITSALIGLQREIVADSVGFYRFAAIPSATYTLVASSPNFSTRTLNALEVTLNRTVQVDVILDVGRVEQSLEVRAEVSPVDPLSSSSGRTITQNEIRDLPVNGRRYLDLMPLTPGVVINLAAANQFGAIGGDTDTPVLGERSGNTFFMIDGLPVRDETNGGITTQFSQETIAEFQVVTAGYKAEFGRGSGGVVNVITRNGATSWHGSLTSFHSMNAFYASNVDVKPPYLLRWDTSATAGGPIRSDRMFVFASAERIHENRRLNFQFLPNPGMPNSLIDSEKRFDNDSRDRESRGFLKFQEQFRRHRLIQEVALTNSHVTDFLPLSQQGVSLPSTREDLDSRNTMVGFQDTALIGKSNDVLTWHVQFREDRGASRPSHPEAGIGTTLIGFSSLTTGRLFGDLSFVEFGSNSSPSKLDQKYGTFAASFAASRGAHNLKSGVDFIRTSVDGVEGPSGFNLLFATISDFEKYGPLESGLYSLRRRSGLTTNDNLFRLRNNSTGIFAQDDWRIIGPLTLNLGVRWDYESAFPAKRNVSPRLGAAWSVTAKTVVRGAWGLFYDHFRLGLVRDIPAFGGADIRSTQNVAYPRLFYGVPTVFPIIAGLCFSPVLTDVDISNSGAACPFAPLPLLGVDHLNKVVAPGRNPISPDAVVTIRNVQSLTGLSPEDFSNAASAAVGRPPGFFFWDDLGHLAHPYLPTQSVPVTVDPEFRAPYTRNLDIGVQRQLTADFVAGVSYYHRDIRNMLGVRGTNLAFEARLPGRTLTLQPGTGNALINGYGPWYLGTYDSLVVNFERRFSSRFSFASHYTFARGRDNAYNSNFTSRLPQGGENYFPSDSFIGLVPVVTDPFTGQSNASRSFVASNGSPIPQAGKHYNGPDLDRGPSDLVLDHAFELHGTVLLPAGVRFSSMLRAQSGFHFSRIQTNAIDEDGDGQYTAIDHQAGRNAFTAPKFVNVDVRFAKTWNGVERLKVQTLFEFFNVFNRANPAAISVVQGGPVPFGKPLQVFPGREGQVGVRFEY